MAWIDDYSVDFSTGNIRRTGGATRYPVIDMHRALMTLVANATKGGDDLGDITDLFVPSKRSSDTDITLFSPMNVDASAVEGMFGGSITYNNGDDKYSGLAIGGIYNANALPQVFQDNVKLTSYWGFSFSPDSNLGYACRLLIKSRTSGVEIDNGRVRVQSRGYGYIYREATTVLASNESVASLGTIAVDTFNSVLEATIATYNDIINTEGYHDIDYGNGNGGQPYYMEWTKGSRSEDDVYNRIKWATRDGSAEMLYGLTGESFRGITHEISVDGATGTLVSSAGISWATGTGQLLSADSDTAATQIWIQLLTGVAPTDNDVLTAGGTVTVNTTVTAIALGVESVAGNYTGAWIGSKGAGQAVPDVGSSDSFIDLLGVAQAPPNLQNAVVGGMVIAEDRIVLGKSLDGITIDKTEYTGTAANTNGAGTITVNEVITNVPLAGYVRISNGTGEDSYEYTSFSGSVFTLTATLSQNYANNAQTYPLIFDSAADAVLMASSWIYTATVLLAGQVVDDGSVNNTPTVPSPLGGSFTATGYSVNINRTADA